MKWDEMASAHLEYRRASLAAFHADLMRISELRAGLVTPASAARVLGLSGERLSAVEFLFRAFVRHGLAAPVPGGVRLADREVTVDWALVSRAVSVERAIELQQGASPLVALLHAAEVRDQHGDSEGPATVQEADSLAMIPFYRFARDAAVQALATRGSSRFLDVGCGTGRGIEALRARKRRAFVVGIDRSPELLAVAAERIKGHGEAIGADIDQGMPSLDSRQFDGALVVGCLHFLRNWQPILDGLALALRPGGRLCIAQNVVVCQSLDVEIVVAAMRQSRGGFYQRSAGGLISRAARQGLKLIERRMLGCFAWLLFECEGSPAKNRFLLPNGEG